jgi:hypothetical protein
LMEEFSPTKRAANVYFLVVGIMQVRERGEGGKGAARAAFERALVHPPWWWARLRLGRVWRPPTAPRQSNAERGTRAAPLVCVRRRRRGSPPPRVSQHSGGRC